MSNRAINAVLDYSKTKGSQRLLMVIIADGIGKDTGYYRAKIETLRREANCEESYIHKLVKKLLTTGELIVEDVPGHASRFYIPLFEREPGYAPEECHSETHTCCGTHAPLDITREDVRNADDTRRRRPQRGVSQSTLTGVQESTPHQKPRKGVSDSPPLGIQESTPGVSDSPPLGIQESTQYPTRTPDSLPIVNIPGDTATLLVKKEEDAKPLPAVQPIAEVRHPDRATPPPSSAAPPPTPPPMPARDTWRMIRAEMEPVMSPVQRREWLDRLDLYYLGDDAYTLVCPTPYGVEYVEAQWGGHLRAALHHARGPDTTLSIICPKREKAHA